MVLSNLFTLYWPVGHSCFCCAIQIRYIHEIRSYSLVVCFALIMLIGNHWIFGPILWHFSGSDWLLALSSWMELVIMFFRPIVTKLHWQWLFVFPNSNKIHWTSFVCSLSCFQKTIDHHWVFGHIWLEFTGGLWFWYVVAPM